MSAAAALLGLLILLAPVLAPVAARAEAVPATGPVQGPALLPAPAPDIRPALRPDWMGAMPPARGGGAVMRPRARDPYLPRVRWSDGEGGQRALWTRTALAVLRAQGTLEDVVPRDIETWCPAYRHNPPRLRRAFWVGLLSALSWHESTWRPEAVGGGGRWFGLMQIAPSTARLYGCRAGNGNDLKDPEDNLSCAIRIMARTVLRDRAVALHDGRWRGVAADWGPMTSRAKRGEMAAWTREQAYCTMNLAPLVSLRPVARPGRVAVTRSAF